MIYNNDSGMTTGDISLKIVHNDSSTSDQMYFAFYTDSNLVGGIDSEVVYDTFTAGHPTSIEASKLAAVKEV